MGIWLRKIHCRFWIGEAFWCSHFEAFACAVIVCVVCGDIVEEYFGSFSALGKLLLIDGSTVVGMVATCCSAMVMA